MKSPSQVEVCAQSRHGANGIVPTISAIECRWRSWPAPVAEIRRV